MEILGLILAFITAICFGLSTAIQKYALNRMKKFSIKGMLKNKKWLSSLIVGAAGVISYLFAMRIAELSLVQSIVSLAIIIPMLVGFVFFKERLVIYEWVSIILILVGIFLVVY
jgi:drug/metabolite transporter (DMT)-like permease